MEGQSVLLPFGWAGIPASAKGSRCKSETISSRYRSNGYVHQKNPGRLSGRHREQAQLLQDSGEPLQERTQSQARLLLTTSNTSLDN